MGTHQHRRVDVPRPSGGRGEPEEVGAPTTLRIGSVPYLNAKVLVHGLEETGDGYRLAFVRPSRLADQLAAGELDVGLIPAVEFFRIPGLQILPGMAVTASRMVDSVKLFSRVPVEQIRTVGLDTSSRSSVALLKVLFAESFGASPDFFKIEPESERDREDLDAFLLIGDPCLRFDPPPELHVHDLVERWHELTGLPFVFAVWAGNWEADLGRAHALLTEAKRAGRQDAEAIARRFARETGISEAQAVTYVTERIGFDLGEAEQAGLARFYECAARLDLVPGGKRLAFFRP